MICFVHVLRCFVGPLSLNVVRRSLPDLTWGFAVVSLIRSALTTFGSWELTGLFFSVVVLAGFVLLLFLILLYSNWLTEFWGGCFWNSDDDFLRHQLLVLPFLSSSVVSLLLNRIFKFHLGFFYIRQLFYMRPCVLVLVFAVLLLFLELVFVHYLWLNHFFLFCVLSKLCVYGYCVWCVVSDGAVLYYVPLWCQCVSWFFCFSCK